MPLCHFMYFTTQLVKEKISVQNLYSIVNLNIYVINSHYHIYIDFIN